MVWKKESYRHGLVKRGIRTRGIGYTEAYTDFTIKHGTDSPGSLYTEARERLAQEGIFRGDPDYDKASESMMESIRNEKKVVVNSFLQNVKALENSLSSRDITWQTIQDQAMHLQALAFQLRNTYDDPHGTIAIGITDDIINMAFGRTGWQYAEGDEPSLEFVRERARELGKVLSEVTFG